MAQRPIQQLLRIMARLRAPDGCPWDREQSHQSLRYHAVEEVYELIDAIEANDIAAMATHTTALEAAMKEIAETAYSAAAADTNGAAGQDSGATASGESSKGDDDVIDAEFEEGE